MFLSKKDTHCFFMLIEMDKKLLRPKGSRRYFYTEIHSQLFGFSINKECNETRVSRGAVSRV